MFDVITIGAAVVDIFIHSTEFHLQKTEQGLSLCQSYGDKVELDRFDVFSGGGASNTGVGFTRMGFRTAVVAELGQDAFAGVIERELEREQVNTSLLIHEKKEQTGGSVILVGEHGGRTVMVHRGAAAQLEVADLPEKELKRCHWLHLSSIGGRLDVLRAIFALARQQTISLSWNPGKAELKLLSQGQLSLKDVAVEVLCLNHEEWASVAALQPQLLSAIPQVIVTNGAKGGVLYQRHKQPVEFSALGVASVDDTGAGDAFVVGYVSALLLEKTPLQAVQWGIHNSAAVIQQRGAKPGLLHREVMEQRVI